MTKVAMKNEVKKPASAKDERHAKALSAPAPFNP